MSRRAKIVCTLGPATSSQEQITALISAGMDVARLNMSHGSQADHLTSYQRVRAGSDATGRGRRHPGRPAGAEDPPRRLPRRAVPARRGRRVHHHHRGHPGQPARGVDHLQGLADDVRIGDRILIDDGNVQLDVIGVTGDRVHLRVVVGGKISNHKGINLPGVNVSAPALTEKDEADLRWALATGVDMIAMSFVRTPGRRPARAEDHDRHGPCRGPADRQDREAGGGRVSCRTSWTRSTASWWPAATSASSCPLEQVPDRADAGDQARQGAGPPGHRGHPDARVDDQRAPADPGRGLRRGGRGRGRRGRGDALGRDQRRRLPDRDGRHHEPDHRRGRGDLAARRAPPVPDADHHRRRDRPRRRRGRRDRRGQGAGRVHA